MMQKPISAADKTPIRFCIVTLDGHVANVVERAAVALKKDLPGLKLTIHPASEWDADPESLAKCIEDIETADIVFTSMMFVEDHINAVLPALQRRRDNCDAMVCCMSASEIVKLTHMGSFDMAKPASKAIQLMKRLAGPKSSDKSAPATAGNRQMAMLRRLPRILKYIPGKAQDMRAYFLTLQYWLACSDENMASLVKFLVDRYAAGERAHLNGNVGADAPTDYPDVGLFHPDAEPRVFDDAALLPAQPKKATGTVGLLLMRSYVLANDADHYIGVIRAFEARGLKVIPAFASGLDARQAIDKFFRKDGKTIIDTLVSLTGFSLVGGPAYNNADAAAETLTDLDVPYIAAHPLEFQSLEDWQGSARGLMPIESTIMVAIPEIEGATGPMIFGGRSHSTSGHCEGCDRHCELQQDSTVRGMIACQERTEVLADRTSRLVELRRKEIAERKIGVVIFGFPPGAGSVGTAAHLSVYTSLFNTLNAMKAEGYTLDVPESPKALELAITKGNAESLGAYANVHAKVSADDFVRNEPYLAEIEAEWGPTPGKILSDGGNLFILGVQLGNVFVGVQPGFGYEGDPMRLMFERGLAPTHAFSAFYRYMRDGFGADALLHFGTHGALEFMPGKQVGMSESCWADRLIGGMPNFYLYAGNNPSEGTIAKRRSAATLISYLTPPVAKAGLYKSLPKLKDAIAAWRTSDADAAKERETLATVIQAEASALDLCDAEPLWNGDAGQHINKLWQEVLELEITLIPSGLHVVGEPMSKDARVDLLMSIAGMGEAELPNENSVRALVDGTAADKAAKLAGLSRDIDSKALFERLAGIDAMLKVDHELKALMHALGGHFVSPAPGGDLLTTPEMMPSGRNIHGFDPYKMPSTAAYQEGKRQAEGLLARHMADGNEQPESIALVLWGADNLKSGGAPIAQALALLGATPRFDSFGRLAGANLIPLEKMDRPRIDVVMTLSGIFRDLLPLQTKLLAEAAYLAAVADEPLEQNFVRKHALAYAEEHNCDMETAALRVFSNADGAYGSNVNYIVENSAWDDAEELSDMFTKRKGFAYGISGAPVQRSDLMRSIMRDVDLAYQNLESIDVGVTTIDHYFDTLGGINQTIKSAKGEAVQVYICDQTVGTEKVRTLSEQVALETRTRMLNPKWYDAMLEHGSEGVRQIEAHVTNTLGWSATTGQVGGWVYQQLTQTFMLDDELRERLTALNPIASAKLAGRLLEAQEREYWNPDDETLDALRRASRDLEDKLEGIGVEVAA